MNNDYSVMKLPSWRHVFFLLSLCLSSVFARGQTDTLFWFAAPEVSSNQRQFDRPILLRISTLHMPANIIVDMPAHAGFTPVSISIAANATHTLDLTYAINDIENSPSTNIQDKGLRIRSNNAVSAYYEVRSLQCNCNPEIFVLKGNNALGTHFLTPFQIWLNNASIYNPAAVSQFIIVASENNTDVTIYPSEAVVGFPLGQTISVTLQRGETFAVTAASRNALEHLAGSEVIANKPIAITISDDLLQLGTCADLAGDQLIPISKIGTEYLAIKGSLGQAERVFILATEDQTVVEINGIIDTILAKGNTRIFELTASVGSAFIKTSKPAYVLHLSGFGCEVGIAVLPPITCTGSKQVGFTRSTNEGFFMLMIVKSGGEAHFVLNGNSSAISPTLFNNVSGTNGEWKYAVLNANTTLIPVSSASLLSNTTEFFHLGILNGGQTGGCRYGFFSDFQKTSSIKASFTDTFVCIGGSTRLVGQTLSPDSLHLWTGPNGFRTHSLDSLFTNIGLDNSGIYYFEQISGSCGVQFDSVRLTVADFFPKPILASNSPICRGSMLRIFDMTSSSIGPRNTLWYGPDGNLIGSGSFRNITNYNGPDSLYYAAKHTRNIRSLYCDGDTAQILIRLHPFLRFNALVLEANDTLFCEGSNLIIENKTNMPGPHAITWSGPDGFTDSATNAISINGLNIRQGGYYVMHITDSNGCYDLKDSIFIRVIAPLTSPLLAQNNPVCAGDSIHLHVQSTLPDSVSGFWTDGLFDRLNLSLNGQVTSNVTDVGIQTFYFISSSTKWKGICPEDTASTSVQLIPLPERPEIVPGVFRVCEGMEVKVRIKDPLDSLVYIWAPTPFLPDTLKGSLLVFNPTHASHNGFYEVYSQNPFGCVSLEKEGIQIQILPRPVVDSINGMIVQEPCEGTPIKWMASSSEMDVSLRWKGPNGFFTASSDTFINEASLLLNGTYYLWAQMGDCGSTDSLTFTVTLSENPHADFTYTPLEAKAREPIQFVFTGQDAAYYLWRFGDHSAVSSDRDPTHSYMRGGVYTVHLEVANVDNNCFDTSSAQIFIEALWEAVYVPNAFSPNRDGKNELYKPVAIGVFNPVRMHIYNRWGALVFRTDDAEQVGWDGTYNGQPCPPETYTYLIEYENTLGEIKQTKGTVQLLR